MIEPAAVARTLVSPLDLPNRAAKMSASNRHRLEPLGSRYNDKLVIEQKEVASLRKVLGPSNFD